MKPRVPPIDEGPPPDLAKIIGGDPSTMEIRPLDPYDDSRDEDNPPAKVAGPSITPDTLERLTAAMESISKRQSDAAGNSEFAQAMTMLATAITALTAGQTSMVDITRRANLPENKFGPDISVYNPRGDRQFPRPKLKCVMNIPERADPDVLTREEIELLNLLEQGEYTVLRNDRTKIKLTVKVVTKLDSDEPSRLDIYHDTAFTNDYQRTMPPKTDMLRQMLKQKPATRAKGAAVVSMEEEEALILARQFNDGREAAPDEQVISVGA